MSLPRTNHQSPITRPRSKREPGIVRFTLPYPPSVNHYWGVRGKRRYIAAEGQRFRANVEAKVVAERIGRMGGRVAVGFWVIAPDGRQRDGDNLLKALFDALVWCGVIDGDSSAVVRRLQLEWAPEICKPGGVLVTIERLK